ncbi:hypothetical protein MTR_3g026940 [Medicago truncatula]|uniref:Uncharacterized protein n=1 Tax=Medicago truncatula TaxID=3880 RepID=G7J1R5_MEDTR|nr:hypothetical protein MTR_3g026940 [Medicago truncatula]
MDPTTFLLLLNHAKKMRESEVERAIYGHVHPNFTLGVLCKAVFGNTKKLAYSLLD